MLLLMLEKTSRMVVFIPLGMEAMIRYKVKEMVAGKVGGPARDEPHQGTECATLIVD